jgi:hypothetical protein
MTLAQEAMAENYPAGSGHHSATAPSDAGLGEWNGFIDSARSVWSSKLMKRKRILLVSLLALALSMPLPARAYADDAEEAGAMICDTLIARPACLAATVAGSVFFVISLPFALISKKVDRAAEVMVVYPARATFTRPLGDFDI